MSIADRIQTLRKGHGISQEELADIIGVSRQAISKWESGQTTPDIEKIILLSDYFHVTTDYLLKGITPNETTSDSNIDARLFSAIGTAFNFIGLVTAIFIWLERQTSLSVAVGLILMAFGCTIFVIGQFLGSNKTNALVSFQRINIWIISLIPVSCIFNFIQGTLGGHWWSPSPLPQFGNSIISYGFAWIIYFLICIAFTIFRK